MFRTGQYFLNQQEFQALAAIERVTHQRDLVSEFERLVAFAQNRTSPQYPMTARLLTETYKSLVLQHARVMPNLKFLGRRCQHRPCEHLFKADALPLAAENIESDLLSNKLTPEAHNALLQRLFDLSVSYHLALKDSMDLSFSVIHNKIRTNATFDFIAYFALIALLLIQALYVFRPAIRRLNASLATRSEFMSRISHEIRNPMNCIIGMADILKSTRLNSEQQHYVENLIRSGHALLDLLNNLIDSSALERGKLSLKPEPFDLQRTLDRSLNLIAIQAHHKNINVYLHLNPAVPSSLIGDSIRLEQVLGNLLGNAVKFTEQGYVCLDIEILDDDEQSACLRFSVF
ncbi:MAG: hypothetical protein HC883_01400 [Bdellovibrionaceae bacterium]|nr:hypothetical protein [Pseudobdellovibrionaceae bacterium]